jgi:PII-like signaling protein
VKAAGARAAVPVAPATLKGKATLMRIFLGEQDRWRGKRLHDAIVESLRAHDIAGATVYRGIAGYGANSRLHKEKRMSLSSDLPVMVSVVDEEARLRAYLPVLYRGIEGYGASSRIHRKHLLTSAALPIVVCLIDTREKIEGFLPTIERMVSEGLIAISDVDVIRYSGRVSRPTANHEDH